MVQAKNDVRLKTGNRSGASLRTVSTRLVMHANNWDTIGETAPMRAMHAAKSAILRGTARIPVMHVDRQAILSEIAPTPAPKTAPLCNTTLDPPRET